MGPGTSHAPLSEAGISAETFSPKVLFFAPELPVIGELSAAWTRKATAIRRKAVREAGVSRHHGASLRAPLKPLRPSQHYRTDGFEGGS